MKTVALMTTIFAGVFLAFAVAEHSQPTQPTVPVGMTGRYETVKSTVLKVYSAEDNGAHFRAYVVKWKDKEVIVSDMLGRTNKKEGDSITFMAQRIEMPHPHGGERMRLLHFMIMEFPGMPTQKIEQSPGGDSSWKFRSCKHCGAVQRIEALSPPIVSSVDVDRIVEEEWKWRYQGRDYRTCQHEWKQGVSRAVPTKISNGQVKGEVYGGFMLIAQGGSPATAQFQWRYGTDANGEFDMSDASVIWSDTAKDVQNRGGELMIEFGPFKLEWSRNSRDKGWIYYTKSPGDELNRP